MLICLCHIKSGILPTIESKNTALRLAITEMWALFSFSRDFMISLPCKQTKWKTSKVFPKLSGTLSQTALVVNITRFFLNVKPSQLQHVTLPNSNSGKHSHFSILVQCLERDEKYVQFCMKPSYVCWPSKHEKYAQFVLCIWLFKHEKYAQFSLNLPYSLDLDPPRHKKYAQFFLETVVRTWPWPSRHVSNGEILGVTLLMEDVLQAGPAGLAGVASIVSSLDLSIGALPITTPRSGSQADSRTEGSQQSRSHSVTSDLKEASKALSKWPVNLANLPDWLLNIVFSSPVGYQPCLWYWILPEEKAENRAIQFLLQKDEVLKRLIWHYWWNLWWNV